MKNGFQVVAADVRRVRRSLDETQATFAKRLDVDPVSVARWETGQRRCVGHYALAVASLASEQGVPIAATGPVPPSGLGDEAKLSALTQFIRAFLQGGTAKAVSALVEREQLSGDDLDELASLIRKKQRLRGRKS